MRLSILGVLFLLAGQSIADDLEDGSKFYVEKKYSQAIASFKKAADQGNARAQYNLGLMYAKGVGVALDYQQAYAWLHKAADQGIGDAEYNLAIMYDNGLGVTKDYPVAVFWYRKAVEHGVPMAHFNLGAMYDNGLGVAQDYSQAVSLYRYAAERGVAQAQYNLATLYESGMGVAKDYVQAAMWFHRAAGQGLAQAKTALADMLGRGLVVPRDYQQIDPLPNKVLEQEIVAALQQWAMAWSAKDVAGYLAFYADNFKTPAGVNFSDWKASRQTQIAKPKVIAVSVSDPQVNISDESHGVVRFRQSYRSSLIKDVTAKTLTLSKSSGKWLIVSEEAKRY